jgi:hypothetical protein
MDRQTVAEPGFSRRDDIQAGTFHYLLGLVAFKISPKAQEALKRIGQGEVITADEGDEDSLLEMAQEIFGLIHEMRHFVDAFGTLSGWSLINRRIELLQRFVGLSEVLNAAGVHWKLPLSDWAVAPDCPDVIRRFIHDAHVFNLGADLLICPFEPVTIKGHVEDNLLELDYVNGGNPKARSTMIELAWLWLRHQPDSPLSVWFRERVGILKGRIRRITIVAVARKLLIALWRYLETGMVPTGAVLN